MAIRTSASLYVGDLHPDVSDTVLLEAFSRVGNVLSARVCRDLQTRRSLGYGYVNFANPQDAERAIETMNFQPLLDRPIRVSWSQRDPSMRKSGVGNVFVKNLMQDTDNKKLYDLFSPFGNIVSLKIMTSDTGASKGYAYVQFDSPEAAEAAIQGMNGVTPAGFPSPLAVAHFQRRADRLGSTAFTNVYFKGFDRDTVTEADLRALLGAFGEITSMFVPTDGEKVRGFGFANFRDANAAKAAIEALHDKEWKGRKLYVQRAQTRKERETLLRSQREQRRAERQRRFFGLNLYVRNLDESIDDAALSQAFSAHGTITSAKVMRDDKQQSRGFGFVCFATQEEAQRAMSEMHNRMLGSKPLYVSLHQPREQRMQYLEQMRARSQPMRAGMPFQPGMYGPMFYGPMPAGRPGMPPAGTYPFPMRGPMWGGPRGQPPQGAAGPRPPMPAQPFPGAMGPYAGAPRTGPRPARGPRPQGVPQPAAGPQAGAARIQFKSSARNIGAPAAGETSAVPATAPAPSTGAIGADLTPASLAALDEQTAKRVLGERLYPMVATVEPALAPKITGMLLQMDVAEVVNLLDSRDALLESIREALEVLQSAGLTDAQAPSA